MSYFFPEDVAPAFERAFLHSLGILANIGIVQIDRNGDLLKRGEKLVIPRFGDISDPQRRDISTTGQTRSFGELSSTPETGVILHDDVADQFPLGNATFSGMDFQSYWLSRAGYKLARRVKQQIYRVAKAAIEAADTTDGSTASANIHIYNQYSKTVNQLMSVERLFDARQKMGDAAGLLTVAVMNSTAWGNLFRDKIGNYVVDSVAGRLINSGGITDQRLQATIRETFPMRIAVAEALGMTIIIDDDLTKISTTGATYTYKSKYETLLFGPGAVYLGYQRNPAPYLDTDLSDARGAVLKMRAELDYCPHLLGITWNSVVTNPTDAQLATKANWDEAYTDHRQVPCVKLITNG